MITVGEIIIMLRQKRMMLIRMALKTITMMALRMMKMMWMMTITLQGRRQLHVVARCSVAASYSPALLTLPATK